MSAQRDGAAAVNSPAAGNAAVRWLRMDMVSHDDVLHWRAVLDDDELRRADSFAFAADCASYTAAHALARTTLGALLGVEPGHVRFERAGAFEKPRVAGTDARIGFSLSHCRSLVACAVTNGDVGVDVERIDRSGSTSTIAGRFSADEEDRLRAAPAGGPREELFFRLWTLKESVVKATGEGLRRSLSSFSIDFDPLRVEFRDGSHDGTRWHLTELRPTPNHALAVAVRAAGDGTCGARGDGNGSGR